MKKIVGIVIGLMLILAVMSGCGKSADTDSLKTIGDLVKLESMGYTYDSKTFVTVFKNKGDYFRAEAKMSADVSEVVDALDWEDPNHDKKLFEAVSKLEITKLINLSEKILSQEELDKLAGKTGADLLNEGWRDLGFYPDENSIYMEYDFNQYSVTFDKAIEYSDGDDMEEVLKPLTVKSIKHIGISYNAADVD
ncbi:MAG: hypothetical protein J6U77_01950 [Verrucomicrobia bacterium]|nr:hypothetical protein [Verrucomicrobiota bacterium]